MKKECPKCGCQLPEEAAFCLNCFYSFDTTIKTEKEKKKRFLPLLLKLKHHKKRIFGCVAAVSAFLILMGICIAAMKAINTGSSIKKPGSDTTVIKETVTVAVTDNSGVVVTDSAGEQIFDIVEVTKIETLPAASSSTTEKQGFFDKIFNKNETEKNTEKNTASSSGNGSSQTSSAPETTEKQSFLDKLFGNKEETTSKNTDKTTSANSDNTTSAVGSSTTKPTEASTVAPVVNTTKPVTTTRPATTQPPATQPATTQAPSTSLSDFEYTLSDKYATIEKYNGSASSVCIPAVVEGKAVTRISTNAFQDNNTVEYVTFATDSRQPYLWVEPQTFNNCSALRVITFSDTDLGIMNNFAWNCTSIENLHINSAQYKCIDGTLYYNSGSGWKLRWHCPASSTTTITLPSYCNSVETGSNLKEAVNVKTINIHRNVITIPHPSILPPNCENVFVEDGNANAFDINGIAFYKQSGMWATLYPSQNRTKSLTLPENTCFYGQYIKNAYLETIYIPQTTKIHSIDSLIEGRVFTSLKSLYIQGGHEKEDYILKNSTIPKTSTY